MANRDVKSLTLHELELELAELRGGHDALERQLQMLSQRAETSDKEAFGRKVDLTVGVVATIGGFVTMTIAPLAVLVSFAGAFSCYRSGFGFFKAAADDAALTEEVESCRRRLADNRKRAEAVAGEIAARSV